MLLILLSCFFIPKVKAEFELTKELPYMNSLHVTTKKGNSSKNLRKINQ